jgi:hypothetical protein
VQWFPSRSRVNIFSVAICYSWVSVAMSRVRSRYKIATRSADLKSVPFPQTTLAFSLSSSAFLLRNDTRKLSSASAEQEYTSSRVWPPNEDRNLLRPLHPWTKTNDPRSCLTFRNDTMYVHYSRCSHILSWLTGPFCREPWIVFVIGSFVPCIPQISRDLRTTGTVVKQVIRSPWP